MIIFGIKYFVCDYLVTAFSLGDCKEINYCEQPKVSEELYVLHESSSPLC